MVSFEKRTATIINPKQTQVMQVRIQSTKRKYVDIGEEIESTEGDRESSEGSTGKCNEKRTPRTPFGNDASCHELAVNMEQNINTMTGT